MHRNWNRARSSEVSRSRLLRRMLANPKSGALASSAAIGKLRRNMPDPIPMAILGRLAIDNGWRGRGLGGALFRVAAQRVLFAAGTIGIRGLLVHAISAEAAAFYQPLGLESVADEPQTLMVTLAQLRAGL